MTRESLHVGRRKLGREHFAWYRGLMEGVDVERLWDQYLGLEGEFSEPLSDATAQWIRLELLAYAQQDHPLLLGLLRRDPRRIKTVRLPTLDEFAETLSDPDFYSQSELQELWINEFGHREGRNAKRRRNVTDRLRNALVDLERNYTKTPPALSHPVAQWFVPQLASSLSKAGVDTLGQLVDMRRNGGPRWWAQIERVGEVAAARLGGWLEEQFPTPIAEPGAAQLFRIAPIRALTAQSIEDLPNSASTPAVDARQAEQSTLPLDVTVALPAAPPVLQEAAPSPVEIVAPSGLTRGLDAGVLASAFIKAQSDEAAVRQWLEAKATNPTTRRTYAREAERFLLWCVAERGKTFNELDLEDCVKFRLWVSILGRKSEEEWSELGWRVPQVAWIGKRIGRESPAWRPFNGPLNYSSQKQAVIVTGALFRYLQLGGYLPRGNPWPLIGPPALPLAAQQDLIQSGEMEDAEADRFVERSLDVDQKAYLMKYVRKQKGVLARRMELVMWLGFGLGLRAAEMCSLNLTSILINSAGEWRLRVRGKGSKPRIAELAQPAVSALLRYLAECGIDEERLRQLMVKPLERGKQQASEPAPFEPEPLLRSHANRTLNSEKTPRLGYRGLHAMFAKMLVRCALQLELEDPISARKFVDASLHSMRHTFGTLMADAGEDLRVIQQMMDHKDLNTTARYMRTSRAKMRAAADRMADAAEASFRE